MNFGKYIAVFTLLILSVSASFAQNSDFASFDEELSNRIELYPNPASDYLNIEIKESNLVRPVVLVHNIIGNSIQVEIEKVEDNKYQVAVKNLPDGYYLVSIKDPGTNFSKTYKFLKK